jgi:rhamnogalacturonyl hydrolase YesR
MQQQFIDSFTKLKTWVEAEDYKGWDPFDGLNSKVFKATPLKYSRFFRLAWIQFFKRCPVNLRSIFLIDKDYNAKGLGLLLYAYCMLMDVDKKISGLDKTDITDNIDFLAEKLIEMISPGYSGACWGYNFDWQNRVFFQPDNTPTVVATSFVANAFFEAFEVTRKQKYLDTALSAISFILKDLNRTNRKEGVIFSYSPLDNSKVYNASLLGARLLARGYFYTGQEQYKELAQNAINAVVEKQFDDGSWLYGEAKTQLWIDSYHTGYNLESIHDYTVYTQDHQFDSAFEKGFDYYIQTFFINNELPKYYHDKLYPIDIHSPAQLIVTLSKTNRLKAHLPLAEKVLNWTITNMQDPKGYFYYQLKPLVSSKIPYMRWAEAWMFYAFSTYFYKLSKYESLD